MNTPTYTPIPKNHHGFLSGVKETLEEYTKRSWLVAKPILQELEAGRLLTKDEVKPLTNFMKMIHPILANKLFIAFMRGYKGDHTNMYLMHAEIADYMVTLYTNPYVPYIREYLYKDKDARTQKQMDEEFGFV